MDDCLICCLEVISAHTVLKHMYIQESGNLSTITLIRMIIEKSITRLVDQLVLSYRKASHEV